MGVVNITEDNYEELVVKNDKKVLLDFYAVWCGPCQMQSPIVEELAQEREDILVGKVNTDEAQALAIKFKVMSIPTLVVLDHGEVVHKSVGLSSKEEILEMLQ